MKYEIWPLSKPDPMSLIYWINWQRKEVLGYYLGQGKFVDGEGTYKGYYVKYWRLANPEDQSLVSWVPGQSKLDSLSEPKPEKRKYTKRLTKEPKPEKVKGKRGRPKKVQ